VKIVKLLALFAVVLVVIAVPFTSSSASEVSIYYGMLSKVQFDPPYIFLSTAEGSKNFTWAIDETLFIGDNDTEMTPQQFAKTYQGKSVEVTVEGSKVKTVKRVFF